MLAQPKLALAIFNGDARGRQVTAGGAVEELLPGALRNYEYCCITSIEYNTRTAKKPKKQEQLIKKTVDRRGWRKSRWLVSKCWWLSIQQGMRLLPTRLFRRGSNEAAEPAQSRQPDADFESSTNGFLKRTDEFDGRSSVMPGSDIWGTRVQRIHQMLQNLDEGNE